jgi:hypothetical protein
MHYEVHPLQSSNSSHTELRSVSFRINILVCPQHTKKYRIEKNFILIKVHVSPKRKRNDVSFIITEPLKYFNATLQTYVNRQETTLRNLIFCKHSVKK